MRRVCLDLQAPAEERRTLQDSAGHRPDPLEAEQPRGQADLALPGGGGGAGPTADPLGGTFPGPGDGERHPGFDLLHNWCLVNMHKSLLD